jgi:hypothetical protein
LDADKDGYITRADYERLKKLSEEKKEPHLMTSPFAIGGNIEDEGVDAVIIRQGGSTGRVSFAQACEDFLRRYMASTLPVSTWISGLLDIDKVFALVFYTQQEGDLPFNSFTIERNLLKKFCLYQFIAMDQKEEGKLHVQDYELFLQTVKKNSGLLKRGTYLLADARRSAMENFQQADSMNRGYVAFDDAFHEAYYRYCKTNNYLKQKAQHQNSRKRHSRVKSEFYQQVDASSLLEEAKKEKKAKKKTKKVEEIKGMPFDVWVRDLAACADAHLMRREAKKKQRRSRGTHVAKNESSNQGGIDDFSS